MHYCGYILSPLQSMLKGLCHSHDPGVTRTESRTALGKLFRLTKPFAKRKGRTAETVRPSRRLLLFLIIHLYEKEAKRRFFL